MYELVFLSQTAQKRSVDGNTEKATRRTAMEDLRRVVLRKNTLKSQDTDFENASEKVACAFSGGKTFLVAFLIKFVQCRGRWSRRC